MNDEVETKNAEEEDTEAEDWEDLFDTIADQIEEDLQAGKIGRRVAKYFGPLLDRIKENYCKLEAQVRALNDKLESTEEELTDFQTNDLDGNAIAAVGGYAHDVTIGKPNAQDVARFLEELGYAFEPKDAHLAEALHTAARFVR